MHAASVVQRAFPLAAFLLKGIFAQVLGYQRHFCCLIRATSFFAGSFLLPLAFHCY